MKVSVIVPVYNVEMYINKCLKSLIYLDFDDYEIIVVIDGSTDGSQYIVEQYKEQYPSLVRIIVQENQGLGGARNTGIKNAKGEFLFFVDSDDTVEPDVLKLTYNKAIESKADMVCFNINYVDVHGNFLREDKAYYRNSNIVNFQNNCKLISNPCAWNKLIRKDLFISHQIIFPDRIWFEDLATIPKLYLHAGYIEYIDKALYNYVQRPGSIINSDKLERNIEIVQAMDNLIEYYVKENAFEEYYKELEFLAVFHILLNTIKRINILDRKSSLQNVLRKYIKINFKGYTKNRYYRKLCTGNEKITLWLINNKLFGCLHILLKYKK